MDQTRCHTTEKIEDEISKVTQPVFDVISEDIENPHVHDNVKEPSMKKHGSQKGKILLEIRKVCSEFWIGVSEGYYSIKIKDLF
jgi:hypothetical protein